MITMRLDRQSASTPSDWNLPGTPIQQLRGVRDAMLGMHDRFPELVGLVDLEYRTADHVPCHGARIRFHMGG